ncbi:MULTISPECIES: glycerophosphodiester phosphodiesterase [Rhizobium]|uniref:Glycerophosphodiester phosphodiesterase n=1 Tax=Rhizobium phaseoli TaxID=396 RepID=A0A2U3CS23_9HYPH|nr:MULTISPECIES: glycerophosphodiester phosphodiesterase family protein [Rhizobium]ANL50344.1 glycerophosphoryl diester phosphodiesterase protein [Rhizobium phaseoli]ANL88452.1 glycerophosphoryl diester phosphodiesterase protein [Rhizobium phaseoli]ANL94961.1 glycerophosphoryl diester phosphodiesterase protein [Rhizobium phaseoli]MDE8757914.1 glycerophosphodiester phosphodiesterase [Rhizobium sp. CBK13]NKF09422.1 glycerophosphodiester phosphodiesterase [Rhizobium phaseoli]
MRMTKLLDAQGLEILHEGQRTRLKWHRLRKRFADRLFSAQVMAEGFAIGASMELDLRVRADGGFVVLHDSELEGETTGHGPIAGTSLADLRKIRMKDGDRPLTLSEDLAAMMQSSHPAALLQFDIKDDYEAIGVGGIAHLAEHFRDVSASVIVSAGSLDLIVAVKEKLPHLLRGIDPTDKLYDIRQAGGWKAVETELRADLSGPSEPDTVYLHWPLILAAAKDGLDMIGLCRDEGKRVDAWTFTLKDPEAGFSEDEWRSFSALMALKPDQITTDEAPATERAWRRRVAG